MVTLYLLGVNENQRKKIFEKYIQRKDSHYQKVILLWFSKKEENEPPKPSKTFNIKS
jgi:hypothetical protein